LYCDFGLPGLLGDSTIYNRSALKKKIDDGAWLGGDIKSLQIGDIQVRPYLLGDCAFSLQTNIMKSSSKQEIAADPSLASWDAIASATRKPVECAFGITKNRFPSLKYGIRLWDEDDACYLIASCFILHNLCIDSGDTGEEFLTLDRPEEIVSSEHTLQAKNIRKALLHYAVNISPHE